MNDIWGGDALTEWGRPFWELSIAQGQQMLERAVHSHLITSRHGAPLMIERDAGLIIEVTDGDTLGYRGNLFYDLAKNAVIRLAYAMAADPNVGAKSGGLFSTWTLSKEYGLTDVDGRRPDWGTFFPRKVQEIVDGDERTEMNLFIVRSRLYQAQLDPVAAEETGRLRSWLAGHD